MEGAVNNLEAMFQKTESDLNYISRKLDAEFSNEVGDEANPARMLQRLSAVKKDYAELLKEAEELKQAQLEAADFFKTQLLTACTALQKLQVTSGVEGAEKPEELTQLETMLGLEASTFPAAGLPQEATHPGECSGDGAGGSTQQNHTEAPTHKTPTDTVAPVQFELSPSEKRAQSDEFIEVNEEEFKSVSALTRGRVKLADVNSTYRRLWQHFKEEGNSESLTTGQMHKMGMRVTGQTGEAKLNVLKSLKLINMNRNRDVTFN